MKSTRRIGLVAAAVLAVVGVAPASTADARNGSVQRPAPGSLAPLLDATRQLQHGTRTATGCDFVPPVLHLAPDEQAIETRQVEIDFATCTTVWETGTPTVLDDGTALLTESSRTTKRGPLTPPVKDSGAVAAASGVGSGYEKGWITDIPGLTVNSVQSNLSWAWNGSCTTAGSGTTDYWWRSGTGWSSPYNKSSVIYPSCSIRRVESKATYKNSIFCLGYTVYAYYTYVTITGWYNGSLTGTASVSHSTSCLALFDHYTMVRTT